MLETSFGRARSKRQGDNPKRRIASIDKIGGYGRLANEAQYAGSPHHKQRPADYGRRSVASPRITVRRQPEPESQGSASSFPRQKHFAAPFLVGCRPLAPRGQLRPRVGKPA